MLGRKYLSFYSTIWLDIGTQPASGWQPANREGFRRASIPRDDGVSDLVR